MTIRSYLQSRAVDFDFLLHRPTHSATHLAGSLHVPGRSVAKGVLIRAGDAYVLAVLPATHRVDVTRLAEVLGTAEVRIATEAEVERVFADCEPGALPPFGRLYGLTTVLDLSLALGADMTFIANMRHEGVRMRFADYEAIEAPIEARFSTKVTSGGIPEHRIAG